MSGRKEQIDWEAVEREYRLGQLSIRELARRFEIEASTITRKAKKCNWARDFSDVIHARTRAGTAAALVVSAEISEEAQQKAHSHATESNIAQKQAVDLAVATNLEVLRQHNSVIRDGFRRLKRLTEKYDVIAEEATEISELAKLAGANEGIVRAAKTLIALERELLNLDEKEKDNEAPTTYTMHF